MDHVLKPLECPSPWREGTHISILGQWILTADSLPSLEREKLEQKLRRLIGPAGWDCFERSEPIHFNTHDSGAIVDEEDLDSGDYWTAW